MEKHLLSTNPCLSCALLPPKYKPAAFPSDPQPQSSCLWFPTSQSSAPLNELQVDPAADPQVRIPALSHPTIQRWMFHPQGHIGANTAYFGALYTFSLGLRLYFLIIMSCLEP